MYLGTRDGKRTSLQAGDTMIWSPRNGTVQFAREADSHGLYFFLNGAKHDDKRLFPTGTQHYSLVTQFAELLADMHDLRLAHVDKSPDGSFNFHFDGRAGR
jgi:hypothetical protein